MRMAQKKNKTHLNPELRDIGTHMAGLLNQHETRETSQPEIINPPAVPNPGPYDTRTGNYE
ncbi:hypothetical protein [Ammoniphilus sp. CFH 90114]|uniref:hypothetical protein n=1 Tax=Ammoniphilus sp. CFH 90114 TaxID=2493665 RepID=UPI00100EAED7|nr:hypothetical protein [Ammoniphilus sp. CFH 90114]RXT04128.1 hypothetical protein EIZ39_21350 [Ammoniphilus sp. CFH 90114]